MYISFTMVSICLYFLCKQISNKRQSKSTFTQISLKRKVRKNLWFSLKSSNVWKTNKTVILYFFKSITQYWDSQRSWPNYDITWFFPSTISITYGLTKIKTLIIQLLLVITNLFVHKFKVILLHNITICWKLEQDFLLVL